MSITANDIIAALPSLSAADLKNIRTLIDRLTGSSEPEGEAPTPERLPDGFAGIMFTSLADELKSRGIRTVLPYHQFAKSQGFKSWKTNIGSVEAWVNQHFGPRIKRGIEKRALVRTLIGLLIDDAKKKGIPLSLGSVANNIQRIPEVFENHFPGYLQSGLAHLVIEQLKRRGIQ